MAYANGKPMPDKVRTNYFIQKNLRKSPFVFMKEDGVWYKRHKNGKGKWKKVVYPERKEGFVDDAT